jgi:histidinol dehydrogenase
MLAGPSEIMVIADESANADYVARDLLSQAEHDELAHSVLLTDSKAFLAEVNRRMREYTNESPRKEIIEAALSANGKSVLLDRIEDAFDIANAYGPEHLEVVTRIPETEVMSRIRNAGSVFLGNYASEPLGDYMVGSNHVLPTFGSSRFSSPLGVYNFYRRVNFISANESYIREYGEDVIRLAEYEGLNAHANAVRARYEDAAGK